MKAHRRRGKQTIAVTAQRAGVGVETVRYYERIGLIDRPPKPARGYREYPDGTVARIQFIKRAQELGFTLSETRTLLELGDGCCSRTEALARSKLDKIEGRLRDLQALHDVLSGLVTACRRNPKETDCPLIGAITDVPDAET